MCHWIGSSWSVEGSTSYNNTYVTPHISPNLAILLLLDPEGKSTTILQNTGNHFTNDISCSKKPESLSNVLNYRVRQKELPDLGGA
jgi:hypothetical protein